MDLLEKIIFDKLEKYQIEHNKEWFLSNDIEEFIKTINEYKQLIDKN